MTRIPFPARRLSLGCVVISVAYPKIWDPFPWSSGKGNTTVCVHLFMTWRVVAGTALLHWNVVVVVIDDGDDDERVQSFLLCIAPTTYSLTQGFHDGSSLASKYLRAYWSSFYLAKTLYLTLIVLMWRIG